MIARQENDVAGLLQQGAIWRGRDAVITAARVLKSGIEGLDGRIGGGWPQAALVEILSPGTAGLSLLVPLLVRLGDERGWQSWINPPYIPYAPALRARGINTGRVLLVNGVKNDQALWAGEQALRAGACTVVLIWVKHITAAQVRRLQLSAEAGNCLGVLFRPVKDARQPSPAALRLQIKPDIDALQVQVLKRKGGWGGDVLRVAR